MNTATTSTRGVPWTAALTLLLALLLVPLPSAVAQSAGERLGTSDDATEASIDIAQGTRTDGAASRVVVATRAQFPDNLAGAGAVGPDGALLLVDGTTAASDEVIAELERLLGDARECPDNPGLQAEVVILGGTAAISPAFEESLDGFCTARIAGGSRNETSVAVAQALLDSGGTRGTLLIARDDNPADSAAAGAYAAANGLPIVVTPATRLHPSVAALLDPAAGAWQRIVILGGAAAVTPETEQAIRDAAGPGAEVSRIAGASRDDTARLIATQLWGASAGQDVAIVNGYAENFWVYALPGGAALGGRMTPLLYVQSGSVPAATREHLGGGPTGVITLGPASLVSDDTKSVAEGLVGGTSGGGGAGTGSGGGTSTPGLDGLRRVDLQWGGTPGGSADVSVELMAGETAIHVTAVSPDGGEIEVAAVSGPTGQAAMEENANQFESSATIPNNELRAPLVPGTYTFTITAEGSVSEVTALIKNNDNNAPQTVDSILYVITDSPLLDTPAERDAAATTLRSRFDEIFGPHNMFAGAIEFADVSADLKAQYRIQGIEPEQFNPLCQALTSLSGDNRRLVFGIVDGYAVDGVSGIARGVPGSAVIGDRGSGCTTMAMDAHIDEDGGFNDSDFAQTTWHEAGHTLGLFHTTEAPGDQHDPVADTPECPTSSDADGNGEVSTEECAGNGAGDNIMFYEGFGRSISGTQADILRHNPVFRPRA